MLKIPHSILRNLTLLAITLVVVGATHVARFSLAAETESDNAYMKILLNEDYDPEDLNQMGLGNVKDATDALIKSYHKNVNKIFNERIKSMATTAASENPADIERMLVLVTPPSLEFDADGNSTKRSVCVGEDGAQNLSTYCLSVDVVKEYFAFREAMIEARRVAKVKAGNAAVKLEELAREEDGVYMGRGGMSASQQGLFEYGETINRIDTEIDIARQTLDQTLGTYSEMQMALPLHQKYKKIIKSLETYRDGVADIRRQIDLYPSTFLNVTSSQCT